MFNLAIQDILNDFKEHNVEAFNYIVSKLKQEDYYIFNVELVSTDKYFGLVKNDTLILSKHTFDYILLILGFLNYNYRLTLKYGEIVEYSEFKLIISIDK